MHIHYKNLFIALRAIITKFQVRFIFNSSQVRKLITKAFLSIFCENYLHTVYALCQTENHENTPEIVVNIIKSLYRCCNYVDTE